jgi:hypothetical protein
MARSLLLYSMPSVGRQQWLTWAAHHTCACALFAGVELTQGLWRQVSLYAAVAVAVQT